MDVDKEIQTPLAETNKKLMLGLGIFFNQGHVCCAGSRLLVEEGVFDVLMHKLRAQLCTLRVVDPLDKNTDVGAINSKMQLKNNIASRGKRSSDQC